MTPANNTLRFAELFNPKIDIENDNTLKNSLPWREGIKGRGN
jgi:hypothetical protein